MEFSGERQLSLYKPLSCLAYVYFARLTADLNLARHGNRVAEQAVPGHLLTHHPRDTRPGVDSHPNLKTE